MGIIQRRKNKKIIEKFIQSNNGNVQFVEIRKNSYHKNGIYILKSDLSVDDIDFIGIRTSEVFSPIKRENTIFSMYNDKNENIGDLECKQPKKVLEEIREKKRIEEEERKRKEEKENEKRERDHERAQRRIKGRYDDYTKFLIENGANKELIELKAVQDIILGIITHGDGRVIMDGRSPIAYEKPNPDGTFNIGGRMDGPGVSIWYKMSYCNDGDINHYIVLKTRHERKVHYAMDDPIAEYEDKTEYNDEEIYIDKNGNVVDDIQKGWSGFSSIK